MCFEKYWKNGCFGEYHDIYAKNLAEQFYNAGQQSKQAEIYALQKRIDTALRYLEDHEGYDDLTRAIKILKGAI